MSDFSRVGSRFGTGNVAKEENGRFEVVERKFPLFWKFWKSSAQIFVRI